MASTLDCCTSMPVTENPAWANSTTSGSPTYPSPTTPTCAWCVSILRRSVSEMIRHLICLSSPVIKLAFRDDFGRTLQVQIVVFYPQHQADRPACRTAPGCVPIRAPVPRHRAGRSGSGTHGLACAALEKTDIQRVFVHHANKRYVGAIRKARMPLQIGSRVLQSTHASRNRNRLQTRRIADFRRSGSRIRGPATRLACNSSITARAHVHLERNSDVPGDRAAGDA